MSLLGKIWGKRWFQVFFVGSSLIALLVIADSVVGLPSANILALVAGVLTLFGSVWEGTTSRTRKQSNEEILEEANDSEELREEVLDYERLTNILESRGLPFSEMMEKYADESEILLISVTDQDGPEDEEFGESKKDTRFVKWVVDELDGVALTSKTWAIPPNNVPERVKGGLREDIENWLDEEVYGRYDGEYTALFPLVALVDLKRVYSKQDEGSHRHFGETLVMEVIEASESFTIQDYAEALSDRKIDVLDSVKKGDLRFILPGHLSEDEIDDIREKQSIILDDVEPPTLHGLANPENIASLEGGLSKAGIESSDDLAQSINEIAKIWKNKLNNF